MAGILYTQSCVPCTKSEIVYDELPPTQVVVLDDYKVYAGPKAAVGDNTPLTFEVTGSGEDYMDLGDTFLRLRVKITKTNGTPLEDTNASVGPLNCFLHSLFSQVDVTLNDNLVSQSTNTYAYRSYISTLLSYGAAAKKTWLGMEIWEPDEAGQFDSKDNSGLRKRELLFQNGKEVELKGRLHTDLSFQNRLVPNGVTLRVTLTRNKPEFALMAFGNEASSYNIAITQASLEVRKVKLVPKEQLKIESVIAKSGARIPITHVVTKNFSIPQGGSTFDLDSLFMGQIPNRVVLGMVENEAFNGAYDKNAFNFQHFHLNFLCLNVDGKQVPGRPLTPDFANGHYIDCFETLFTGTGMYGDDLGQCIKRSDYDKGYCLFAFNLTPDQSNGISHVNTRRHGTVRASLHFAKALPCTVTVIAFAQFDNVVLLDRHRNIIFDYAT